MPLLIISIVFLVLLLTGILGSALVAGFQIIGWLIVVVLVAILIWEIFKAPFSPLIKWMNKRNELTEIKEKIAWRKKLGYDAEDLEKELQETEKNMIAHIRREKRGEKI